MKRTTNSNKDEDEDEDERQKRIKEYYEKYDTDNIKENTTKPKTKDEKDEQDNKETEEESNDDEQKEQPNKFEETTDGIEKIIKDEIPKATIKDLEYIRDEFEDKLKDIGNKIIELNELIEDKNEIVEVLSIKNIDLINIDMELISNELYKGEVKLNNIATANQFERLNEFEKTKGLNMAYQVSKIYLENAGTEARLVIPTLNLIKISLEKISEKLKFIGDD